jgi:hypothetical protein
MKLLKKNVYFYIFLPLVLKEIRIIQIFLKSFSKWCVERNRKTRTILKYSNPIEYEFEVLLFDLVEYWNGNMEILIFYGFEFGKGKTRPCPTALSYLTWSKLNRIEKFLYIHVEIFIFTHIIIFIFC